MLPTLHFLIFIRSKPWSMLEHLKLRQAACLKRREVNVHKVRRNNVESLPRYLQVKYGAKLFFLHVELLSYVLKSSVKMPDIDLTPFWLKKIRRIQTLSRRL